MINYRSVRGKDGTDTAELSQKLSEIYTGLFQNTTEIKRQIQYFVIVDSNAIKITELSQKKQLGLMRRSYALA